MWYSGRGADAPPLPGIDALTPSSGALGVAISRDGVSWVRGAEGVAGVRGAQAPSDVGRIMEPNKDWWTFDTAHMAVSDVQVGAWAGRGRARSSTARSSVQMLRVELQHEVQ